MIRISQDNRAFLRRVLVVVLPIIIQNGITNFVNLLDNVMVGQVGTIPMSGVAIVNQLTFVYNLCVFGAVAGAGIFTAQFFGSGDHTGVRYTFRYKLLIGFLLAAIGIGVFLRFDTPLIRLYLRGEGSAADAALTLAYGRDYLRIMLLGLLPMAISFVYADTLRETDQTVLPMLSGVAAVAVNLGLNYVLIFGHFGAPALGVKGAAIATVVSRYVEAAILIGWTHGNPEKNPFIRGAYRSAYIPGALLGRITVKSLLLMANEALWSSGMAIMSQCYSTRGLDVVAAANIASTLYNLSGVVYMAMGNAVGIIIGQMLGGGYSEAEVRRADRKLVALSVFSCLIFGGLMAGISGLFPRLYNTTQDVRALAAILICVSACAMPLNAYVNAAYFTLRSGGQTLVTFLFDSCFMWVVCVPVALLLSQCTNIDILPLYIICNAMDLLKCVAGFFLLRQGVWIKNLTVQET